MDMSDTSALTSPIKRKFSYLEERESMTFPIQFISELICTTEKHWGR